MEGFDSCSCHNNSTLPPAVLTAALTAGTMLAGLSFFPMDSLHLKVQAESAPKGHGIHSQASEMTSESQKRSAHICQEVAGALVSPPKASRMSVLPGNTQLCMPGAP